jgi:hypothetical protein
VGSRSNAVAVAYGGAITETIGDGNTMGLIGLVGGTSRPMPLKGGGGGPWSCDPWSWRAITRSKSVESSYNEAEEELTREGSSTDGGRQSEDKESKKRFGHHLDKTNGVE